MSFADFCSVSPAKPYLCALNLHTMPNPTNKQELLSAMADGYAKLNEQIGKMSEEGKR